MALIKKTNFKGIEAEYWAIIRNGWDKLNNKSTCILGLYITRQERLNGIGNFLDRRLFTFDGQLDIPTLYSKIKEPVIRTNGDGEEVDINFFTDSLDD